MNPIVRQFLPSQVRGVYRYDTSFNTIDGANYDKFQKEKSQFLPEKIRKIFFKHINFSENYSDARHSILLDLPTQGTQIRATAFFQQHPYFSNALQGSAGINGSKNYLEIKFVQKVLAYLLTPQGLQLVQPQHPIGSYFADFSIIGTNKFVIEVDGFGKFETREDLDNFIHRQNCIVNAGWKIIRFTYEQIIKTPKRSLRILSDALQQDDRLKQHLITNDQQHLLFDDGNPQETMINVVNNFYYLQDWLVAYCCTQQEENKTLVLYDDFKLQLPFVALAISSLYQFLDTVRQFVEVEFDLPDIEINSPVIGTEWVSLLHPKVATFYIPEFSDNESIRLNAHVIQNAFPFPAPVPMNKAIVFRKGLSVETIREGLAYISQEIFRYPGTKSFQNDTLQRIFDNKDVLGIATTGSGKSFCFWLPSLLKPGLTLVISPLRSLMRDQKLTLLNYGITSVEFINSDVKAEDQIRYLKEAELGYIRILYIAPERLRIKKFVNALEELQKKVPINLMAIDEAHCISEWGHDFRPSYLKLPAMSKKLASQNTECNLMALTATAGVHVEKDILRVLNLSEKENVVFDKQGADRKRFSYQIISIEQGGSKEETYKEVLQNDLSKALKLKNLRQLLDHTNKKKKKQ